MTDSFTGLVWWSICIFCVCRKQENIISASAQVYNRNQTLATRHTIWSSVVHPHHPNKFRENPFKAVYLFILKQHPPSPTAHSENDYSPLQTAQMACRINSFGKSCQMSLKNLYFILLSPVVHIRFFILLSPSACTQNRNSGSFVTTYLPTQIPQRRFVKGTLSTVPKKPPIMLYPLLMLILFFLRFLTGPCVHINVFVQQPV